MSRPLAVLFKAANEDSDADDDPYVNHLDRIGVESRVITVLKFDFINLDVLKSCLEQSESYSGIIFSSPRVVEAVEKCAANISKWRDRYSFAVGEKTAEQVKRLGLDPVGSDSGTGAVLADFILKHDVSKPLLLPCGNLSTNTLFDKLREGGISINRLVVYQTVADPNLEQNVKKIFAESQGAPLKFILYFSPSGVAATMPILRNLNLDLSTVKFGAIGPTTQSSLSTHVEVSFVAEKPTPQHFAEALKKTIS